MPDPNAPNIRIDTIRMSDNPEDYYVQDGLLKALEIAIALGKPLLLSGEPGTGKTRLAYWAAQQLAKQTATQPAAFLPAPFTFPVKSTSQAAELFYYYDAVSHFRMQGAGTTAQFIELKALGLAIAQAHGSASDAVSALQGIRNFNAEKVAAEPRSSVVLIDEIDKAPREFPNDLLNELEDYAFDIREINRTIKRPPVEQCRIVVIITSNSEKNLPNAFLRRCVFYHINFPEDKLLDIAKLKLRINDDQYDAAINAAITEFMKMRVAATNKKPTTSEFLDWLGVLRNYSLLDKDKLPLNIADTASDEVQKYKASAATLLKTTDDIRLSEG